ncbi:hypothetical protein O988_05071 [Pseudogymnoascus sp. VKM F-3808]|nr:hypothetical protein O988_05071 [Pseudogymnoascus sp. VKM F-3808]
MRADIVLTAAIAALLTPSLAVYTCPPILDYDVVPKCCPPNNTDECTNPPKVPENLDEFHYLCQEESRSKQTYCCVVAPGNDGKILRCDYATWTPEEV